jgi:hypothetical protein
LDSHFSFFGCTSTRQQLLLRDARLTHGNSLNDQEATADFMTRYRRSLKQDCPKPANNHGTGRKKSREEEWHDFHLRRMSSGHRKNSRCSLCGCAGHRSMGVQCPVVISYKAPLILWNKARDMAERHEDPNTSEVLQPDEDVGVLNCRD